MSTDRNVELENGGPALLYSCSIRIVQLQLYSCSRDYAYRYRGFRATYTMDSHCGPLCFSESGPTDSHCGLKLYCTVLRYCMVPVVRAKSTVVQYVDWQYRYGCTNGTAGATVPIRPVPPTAGLKVGQLTPTVE